MKVDLVRVLLKNYRWFVCSFIIGRFMIMYVVEEFSFESGLNSWLVVWVGMKWIMFLIFFLIL